jgi:phospholipase/carboxylesterase
MTSPRLDGPRLPPASGGPAKQLVVFLHGYGADGNDLIGLGREWSRLLPHATFVSPNAPQPCGMAPIGRQWFNLTFRDPGEMTRGVAQAGPVLDAFLSAELGRLRLPSSVLGLVGFRQGTVVGLAVGSTSAILRWRHVAPKSGLRRGLCTCRGVAERSVASGPAIPPLRSWRYMAWIQVDA